MLMDLKKLLPGIDKNGKYRLPRLQDIVQNEDYIIVYGYTVRFLYVHLFNSILLLYLYVPYMFINDI